MTLYKQFCTKKNLFSAWHHVRAKALTSTHPKIRADAQSFEENISTHVNRIAGQLISRSYAFPKSTGVLKDRKKREAQGKSPRPIVVPSIEGRLVQRALLQVLQPSDPDVRLGKINAVNSCPHSYGCVPKGSVKKAITDARLFISQGNSLYFKTDIRGFFDQIPHEVVLNFIKSETSDNGICDIFSKALQVELDNKNELNRYYDLFPQDGVGVPQGSSLSAFCGNILLYELDCQINNLPGVKMLRYVDDLLILSDDNNQMQSAKRLVGTELKRYGLTTYDPAKSPDKAGEGHVRNGIDYLGCTIIDGAVRPSRESGKKLLAKINNELDLSKKRISDFCNKKSTKTRSSELCYVGTLARIDRIIYGWSHSFSFVQDRLLFTQLDKHIDKELGKFAKWFYHQCNGASSKVHRRALGVALISDVPHS